MLGWHLLYSFRGHLLPHLSELWGWILFSRAGGRVQCCLHSMLGWHLLYSFRGHLPPHLSNLWGWILFNGARGSVQ
jgi:hypothetical protein